MISLMDFLKEKTAGELMVLAPLSIRDDESLNQAVNLLAKAGVSALAVVDRAGRPVGVLSQRDIIRYDQQVSEFITPLLEYYQTTDLERYSGDMPFQGVLQNKNEMTAVRDVMTAEVYTVPESACVQDVIDGLLTARIHRLFVTDQSGLLLGIVSMSDILAGMMKAIQL